MWIALHNCVEHGFLNERDSALGCSTSAPSQDRPARRAPCPHAVRGMSGVEPVTFAGYKFRGRPETANDLMSGGNPAEGQGYQGAITLRATT